MKSSNTLIIVALTILIGLMFVVMHVQQNKINNYKSLLEMTDSTTYADTIYLDKVIRDTMPQTITQRIYKTDTLWKVQGDSVVGEPQIITLVKKKSAKH